MKIATLEFNGNFLAGDRSMHLYADVFRKKYCEANLTMEEAKTYNGDVIMCFNGRPDLGGCPPREFKGKSFIHLMDHNFQTAKTLRALEECHDPYLMVYQGVKKYDPFFRHFFNKYHDRTIDVPFGYNNLRFKNTKPFNERKNKVVALGAVNPVSDPLCINDIRHFAEFFKDEEYTHKWRHMLRSATAELSEIMDSRLPTIPKTKDFDYDIVQEYNDYKMFTTCESIMRYPSVKTFEGMACGSVLVCSDHHCYKDLGLRHGVNCIMHKDLNINSFNYIVGEWLSRPRDLEKIAEKGRLFAYGYYTPSAVADNLYGDIFEIKSVDKCCNLC